jgi:hypothetical protein
MSLMQKQTMSEENRAAHQRNGRMSHGAATAEGKERSRATDFTRKRGGRRWPLWARIRGSLTI